MATRNRKVAVSLDTYLSILAVVSSFCAIGITFYQAYLQRTQQYASVMPILDSYNTSKLVDGSSGYAMMIDNNGLGPAFIEEASYYYAGKKYDTVSDFENAILKQAGITDSTSMVSDLWKGLVIPQGGKVALIELHSRAAERAIRQRMNDAKITILYKSVYGEKWRHTFPRAERDKMRRLTTNTVFFCRFYPTFFTTHAPTFSPCARPWSMASMK